MTYSRDTLTKGLIAIARLAVGDRLSSFKTSSGATKAAVFARVATGQAGEKIYGKYPYITVVSGTRDRQGASVNSRWYDPVSGKEVLETIYDTVFTFSVFGGDAEQIAGDLEAFFETDVCISFLADLQAVIANTSGVRASTTIQQGVAHDFANLAVTVTATGRVEQDVAEITSVVADLHTRIHDSEDDITTTPITITKP